jgi:hypothetical protein
MGLTVLLGKAMPFFSVEDEDILCDGGQLVKLENVTGGLLPLNDVAVALNFLAGRAAGLPDPKDPFDDPAPPPDEFPYGGPAFEGDILARLQSILTGAAQARVKPSLDPARVATALKTYAAGVREEDILFQVDDTRSGDASFGLVATKTRTYARWSGEEPVSLPLGPAIPEIIVKDDFVGLDGRRAARLSLSADFARKAVANALGYLARANAAAARAAARAAQGPPPPPCPEQTAGYPQPPGWPPRAYPPQPPPPAGPPQTHQGYPSAQGQYGGSPPGYPQPLPPAGPAQTPQGYPPSRGPQGQYGVTPSGWPLPQPPAGPPPGPGGYPPPQGPQGPYAGAPPGYPTPLPPPGPPAGTAGYPLPLPPPGPPAGTAGYPLPLPPPGPPAGTAGYPLPQIPNAGALPGYPPQPQGWPPPPPPAFPGQPAGYPPAGPAPPDPAGTPPRLAKTPAPPPPAEAAPPVSAPPSGSPPPDVASPSGGEGLSAAGPASAAAPSLQPGEPERAGPSDAGLPGGGPSDAGPKAEGG